MIKIGKKQVCLDQVLSVMLTQHTHAHTHMRILKISYYFSVVLPALAIAEVLVL